MAENRVNRDAESRTVTQRPQTWTPPQILPEPNPIPGYKFRWIRTATRGQFDPTNVSSKLREGWEPCKIEDHPEMMVYADTNSRFQGNVESTGMLLCKTPVEMVEQRAAWYANQNRSQIEAVDNSFMKTNDPRMPLYNERKSSISFGKGSK